MLVSVYNAIVFGFENRSRLGNQHGKHASNTQRHLLCLATGGILVCFVCFYVVWFQSLEQCGHYKRKCLCISAQPTSLSGVLCHRVSVSFHSAGQSGEDLPPLSLSLSPPCFLFTPHGSQGPSAFPLWGRLGIGCFYEMDMTQKSIQRAQAVHLKASSAGLPIILGLSAYLQKPSKLTVTDLWHGLTTTPGLYFYIGSQRNSLPINYQKSLNKRMIPSWDLFNQALSLSV